MAARISWIWECSCGSRGTYQARGVAASEDQLLDILELHYQSCATTRKLMWRRVGDNNSHHRHAITKGMFPITVLGYDHEEVPGWTIDVPGLAFTRLRSYMPAITHLASGLLVVDPVDSPIDAYRLVRNSDGRRIDWTVDLETLKAHDLIHDVCDVMRRAKRLEQTVAVSGSTS